MVDRPWSYAAYNAALHEAERLAGVARVKYRAAHGFRRGVAGNVAELTGSEKLAAEWIGDKSVRVVREHYLPERQKQLHAIADRLGAADRSPNAARSSESETPSNAIGTQERVPAEELSDVAEG